MRSQPPRPLTSSPPSASPRTGPCAGPRARVRPGPRPARPGGRRRAPGLAAGLVVALAALVAAPGAAHAEGRFEQGTIEPTIVAGVIVPNEGAPGFILGATVSYYVLDGLAPGIRGEFITRPTGGLVQGTLKYVPFTEWRVTPYVVTAAGRWFAKAADAWIVDAGGGVSIGSGPFSALELGVLVRVYESAEDGLADWTPVIGFSTSF